MLLHQNRGVGLIDDVANARGTRRGVRTLHARTEDNGHHGLQAGFNLLL